MYDQRDFFVSPLASIRSFLVHSKMEMDLRTFLSFFLSPHTFLHPPNRIMHHPTKPPFLLRRSNPSRERENGGAKREGAFSSSSSAFLSREGKRKERSRKREREKRISGVCQATPKFPLLGAYSVGQNRRKWVLAFIVSPFPPPLASQCTVRKTKIRSDILARTQIRI